MTPRVRLTLLGAAAVGLGCASLLLSALPAGADAPVRYGWWTASNPGDPTGLGAPPPPPDVPADGMLVQGPAAHPSAVSALLFDLPDHVVRRDLTLTLRVAPTSANTPGTAVVACPLTATSFAPAEGAPIDQAPAWDCSGTTARGVLNAAGTAWTFRVGRLARDGRLAVALVPVGQSDRAVFARPGDTALTVRTATVVSTTPTPTPTSTPTPTASPSGGPTPTPSQAVVPPPSPVAPPPGNGPVVVPTPADTPPLVATAAPTQVAPAAGVLVDATPLRLSGASVAAALLAAAAVTVWMRGRRRFAAALGRAADARPATMLPVGDGTFPAHVRDKETP